MTATLALLLNACVWGLSWIPFRSLARQDIHPLWSTAIIYAASTAVMIYLCRKDVRTLRQRPLLLGLALAAGLTNACFNTAVATGDVVRVILLFYLMPVWAIVLARLLLHEALSLRSLLKVALGLAGAAVVLGAETVSLPLTLQTADVLAVAGGFLFALNNVLLRRLHPLPGRFGTLAMVSGGCVMSLIAATVWTLMSASAWPPLAQSGPWPTLLLWSLLFMAANACLQYGASRLPAAVTSVLMLSEILFGSVSAWWLGQADIGMKELVGGALITMAALIPVGNDAQERSAQNAL
jgi:drug/metabolite transporter (DMT)-like permease